MIKNHPDDCGTVLFLADDPSSTVSVVGRDRAAVTATDIDDSVWQYGDIGGQGPLLLLYIFGKIDGAGEVKIRVLSRSQQYGDDLDDAWAEIASERADSTAVTSEHTIAAADLISVVNSPDYRVVKLLTTNFQGDVALRVAAKWQQASAAGDFLVVRARRLR